jgi:hypothetical protein
MLRKFLVSISPLISITAFAGHTLPLKFDPRTADEFSTVRPWISTGNEAVSPIKVSSNGMTMFSVAEQNKTMKWKLEAFSTQLPGKYLLVNYRAMNTIASTETNHYFIWIADTSGVEHVLITQGDLITDGKWHLAVVDLSCHNITQSINELAIQVSSGATIPAETWISSISYSDDLPADQTPVSCRQSNGRPVR